MAIHIRSALISVFHKDGLLPILDKLAQLNVQVISTGGSHHFIEAQGHSAIKVEDLTGFPSILDGRVKTLHPHIFGGILARREPNHLQQLDEMRMNTIDLVIVDLYPFEQTVRDTEDADQIIEKIDIGGIALIRAAAKNFKDVLVISNRSQYDALLSLLDQGVMIEEEISRQFAAEAFARSAAYDSHIRDWMNRGGGSLRYGENPHQSARFIGRLEDILSKKQGKDLSYNNLMDVDSAIRLMADFQHEEPTIAIIKHTNSCGLASASTTLEAWHRALACDPISAFGGIIISNRPIEASVAEQIHQLFYEVIIAPAYTEDAMAILSAKSKRIILELIQYPEKNSQYKSCLDGLIVQDFDEKVASIDEMKLVTQKSASDDQKKDLLFAEKAVKHLKSNGIALVKHCQLIGMGCGQTSRVDALRQAIAKARTFGFDLQGACMASDAFFPFPDCVEIADQAGITAVIHPGGSLKDQDNIDYCDAHGMSMYITGTRHFKH